MKRFSIIIALALLTFGFASAVCHAADVRGTYTYDSKGYKGTMTIKWLEGQEGRAFAFVFKTVNKSNGNECDFKAAEMPERTEDDKPAVGESDSGAKFKISFKGNTATVEVVERGGECGMSGDFGGKYVKAKK